MKTPPNIDQIALAPCKVCQGEMEVRKTAAYVIIRCVEPRDAMHNGCGLRFERKGTVDEVVAMWNGEKC